MKDSGMSTGIPKSVREALSRQAVKGPHPAADALTAYVERIVTEQEEAVIAGHLATCPDCRAVVFLAHSAYEAPQKPVIVYERRSMWRWAMPATALLAFVIGFVVLLRNENPKVPQAAQLNKQIQASRGNEAETAPSGIKATDNAVSSAAPASIAPASKSTAAVYRSQPLPRSKTAEKKSLSTTAASGIPRFAENGPQPLSMTLSQPGIGAGVSGGTLAKSAIAAPLPAAAPPAQLPGPQQNANALNVQNMQLGGASQHASQINAQKGVGAASTSSDVTLPDMTTAAIQPPPAPSLRRRDETRLPEQRSSEGQFQAFATGSIELDAAPQKQQRNAFSRMALTVWRISSDGHLERMMQNQWRRALSGVQQSFHAVAYLGNHVWAGGAGPELYHSADGGDSWNTLKVKTEDAELRGAMQSIKATDEKHVAIIADDGSVWVTNDGGSTWTKQ